MCYHNTDKGSRYFDILYKRTDIMLLYHSYCTVALRMLCGWLLLGIASWCGVVHTSCIGKDTATAALGQPYLLTFNYDGAKEFVDYAFIKDGVMFDGDNIRIFTDMDRIYFTKVAEMDSGTYTLEVLSSEIIYNETVKLCSK